MVRMAETTTPLLELRDAVVVRDGRAILDVEHLVLRRAEHVAVIGPNGSGKSTLIGLITRDVLPLARDEAAVRLLGRERWDLFEARRLFGIVSPALHAAYRRRVTVREVVLSGYFGSIGLYRRTEVTREMAERVEALLGRYGLVALAERTFGTLSTGEARRALIARALVHDPPALVLDEPCDGLDPGAAARFLETVRELAAEGRTLVMVTHHVSDIVPEIERVVMLANGRVVADGPKMELLTNERLSALFNAPVRAERVGGWFALRPDATT